MPWQVYIRRVKGRRFFFSIVALLTGCENRSSSGPPPPAPAVSNVEGGADPQTGDIRYLALGDSISQGFGAPDMATGAFPARLASLWRANGCKVELKNLGARHNTSQDVITHQVPQIAAFKPTFITLQVGSNDMGSKVPVDTYRKNVRTILDAAKGSGARVVVLGQNEWHRSPEGRSYGKNLGAQRIVFDAALAEETKSKGAELVDLGLLYRQQADKKMWIEDGIHPSAEAYDQMAAELARVIPSPCRK
jgi:lysophospholipase L1-like esterase